jgi:hypothetical protein
MKFVVLCFAVKLNNALAIKAGFAVKEYLLPGVADNDNCVFFAIIYTIIKVALSAGASVKAVTVNLPSPDTKE